MTRHVRFALAVLAAATASFATPAARADDRAAAIEPPHDARAAADEAARERLRLAHFLERRGDDANRERAWLGATTLGLGTLTFGAGGALLLREPSLPAAVLAARGAAGVAVGLYDLVLRQRPFDALSATMERARLAGMSDAEARASALAEWDDLARRARVERQVSGSLRVVLGLLLTTGAALVAVAPSSSSLDATSRERTLTSSLLASVGIATTSAGMLALVVKAPVEQARDAFRDGDDATPRVRAFVLPVGAGVVATLQRRF